METFQLSYAGKQWNEDYVFVADNFGFVLDGVTSSSKHNFSNMRSDVVWYCQTLGEYIKKHICSKKSIFEILKAAVKRTAESYEKLARGKKVLDFPKSTISLFRIVGDVVEFYTLGDSVILIEDIFGKVFKFFDSRNGINDNIALTVMKYFSTKEKKSIRQTRLDHPEIIHWGKNLCNTRGHQYVLSKNVDDVDYGICFSIDVKLISKVIVLSDGFSQAFDLFKLETEESFVKKINKKTDAEKIYKKLRKMQQKDKDCNKFLRTKETDDSSIGFLKIN